MRRTTIRGQGKREVFSAGISKHGGSQPRIEEGASRDARRGKNAEAFLINVILLELNLYFHGESNCQPADEI